MNDASRSVAWTVVLLVLALWAAHLLTGCAVVNFAASCAVRPQQCN